jgi:hypothetical protein
MALFIVAWDASAALAQLTDWMPGPAHDTAVARALTRFRAGQPIRVALLRNRWSGRFHGARGDTVFLGPADQPPMAVRFNAVDTIWRRGRATVAGAIAGAAAGALVQGLSVALTRDGSRARGRWLGQTAGLVVAGGATGAIVGAGVRRWRRVLP